MKYMYTLYKSGSHSNYNYYKPIAILSVIDKIVEKIIVGQISKFLERHSVLTNNQDGFSKGSNTVSAFTEFADYTNECLGSGKQLIALFIDFNEVFE